MLEYFALVPLMVVVFFALSRNRKVPVLIKYGAYGYFLILTVWFVISRERIKSENELESRAFWEQNATLVDTAMWMYLIPSFVIILFALIVWFKTGIEGSARKIITSVLGLILFFIYNFAIFELFFGYSPYS